MIKDERETKKIIDAHIHFDMSQKDPAENLKEYVERHGLEKVVLIINTQSEMAVLLRSEKIAKELMHRIEFVFGMNQHDAFYEQGKEYCLKFGKKLNIKLHPRLFQICKSEIRWYMDEIEKISPENIVVDNFLYGNSVAEDIGMELICTAAERFSKKKVIMAHAGGVNLLNHVMRTKTYKNVYYDVSLTCNYLFESSIQQDLLWLLKYMSGRIMLGSDYPDFHIGQARDNMESLKRRIALDEEAWDKVIFGNAKTIYGG